MCGVPPRGNRIQIRNLFSFAFNHTIDKTEAASCSSNSARWPVRAKGLESAIDDRKSGGIVVLAPISFDNAGSSFPRSHLGYLGSTREKVEN